MKGYLLTSPVYENMFDKVWLWGEFPFREQFGPTDMGIDLVALTKDHEYWAIQCKCYQEDTQIERGTWTRSSRPRDGVSRMNTTR